MGTKNDPGACHAAAHPDEPMFVLLGRDPMAGSLVRMWAAWRETRGEDPAKVKNARDIADALDGWAVKLGKTTLPMPTAAQLGFSEVDCEGDCGKKILVRLDDEVPCYLCPPCGGGCVFGGYVEQRAGE